MSDPATGLRFHVVIDGVDIGAFTGCDGLSAEYEIEEYAEGGQNAFVHRIPGRLKFQNVKLTRPVDQDSGRLAAWFASLQATVRRQTASIVAFDVRGRRLAQWNLLDVYPMRWTGPSFSSDGNDVAKETLELAHNGFVPGVTPGV
jgi:phage tail-like protein